MKYNRIVVKVGSNVLATKEGLPDQAIMKALANDIAVIKKMGAEVILVSSGAVAFGRSLFSFSGKQDAVAIRQSMAALGQIPLINTWAKLFSSRKEYAAQVLVTKEDFRDRQHYLNMKNCFSVMLQNGIIPVVNENDVVSVTELMFTDNDELAGLVASMLNADAMVILTSVDGVYKGLPGVKGSELIQEVDATNADFSDVVFTTKSNFGRGGMITKCNMAMKTAQLGINVVIANGRIPKVLQKIVSGESIGTRFKPAKLSPDRKKWIAHSETYSKGLNYINEGAKKALLSEKASSILPIGIIKVEGDFEKGEVVKIADEKKKIIGLGKTELSSEKVKEKQGLKNQKPVVHYDYLYLNPDIKN